MQPSFVGSAWGCLSCRSIVVSLAGPPTIASPRPGLGILQLLKFPTMFDIPQKAGCHSTCPRKHVITTCDTTAAACLYKVAVEPTSTCPCTNRWQCMEAPEILALQLTCRQYWKPCMSTVCYNTSFLRVLGTQGHARFLRQPQDSKPIESHDPFACH